MKPFVVNRYGRIVFPFNFFPELDFSVFETLEQFAAVIKRDFEEKAPSETEIVAAVDSRAYAGRYDLLRDLALNLFWVNRYAMTMYEKRPTRWRDVPKSRDDVFLPVFKAMWNAMKATDEQDRLDAIFMAEYEAGNGNGGGGNDPVPAYRRRRPPRPPRNPGGRRAAARKTRTPS